MTRCKVGRLELRTSLQSTELDQHHSLWYAVDVTAQLLIPTCRDEIAGLAVGHRCTSLRSGASLAISSEA